MLRGQEPDLNATEKIRAAMFRLAGGRHGKKILLKVEEA